jgi:hypothetical protein
VLTDLGARIVEVRMPDLTGVMDAWFALCASEIVVAHAANYPSRATEYGPYMREWIYGYMVATSRVWNELIVGVVVAAFASWSGAATMTESRRRAAAEGQARRSCRRVEPRSGSKSDTHSTSLQ